ncbi:hypothetical protein [Tolypothrix sp. NIES-4075]|nr:hypothetical protein [Tolypothrix sp. NIES-4075]
MMIWCKSVPYETTRTNILSVGFFGAIAPWRSLPHEIIFVVLKNQ